VNERVIVVSPVVSLHTCDSPSPIFRLAKESKRRVGKLACS
jgi:hypothetical protein